MAKLAVCISYGLISFTRQQPCSSKPKLQPVGWVCSESRCGVVAPLHSRGVSVLWAVKCVSPRSQIFIPIKNHVRVPATQDLNSWKFEMWPSLNPICFGTVSKEVFGIIFFAHRGRLSTLSLKHYCTGILFCHCVQQERHCSLPAIEIVITTTTITTTASYVRTTALVVVMWWSTPGPQEFRGAVSSHLCTWSVKVRQINTKVGRKSTGFRTGKPALTLITIWPWMRYLVHLNFTFFFWKKKIIIMLSFFGKEDNNNAYSMKVTQMLWGLKKVYICLGKSFIKGTAPHKYYQGCYFGIQL